MKIFDVKQTREADKITINNQGITSADLMERAGREAFLWIKSNFPDKETVFHVFCGKGNNGGDGLVIGRLLYNDGYQTYINIVESGNPTIEFSAAFEKLTQAAITYNQGKEISSFGKGKAVVIDGLFGIGLNRELNDEYHKVIENINKSNALIVSIDIPSGMFIDKKTTQAVKSDIVVTFQYPKLPFYMSSNYQFIKQIVVLDIGLDKDYLTNTESYYHVTDKAEAFGRYKPVSDYAHKGTQGHALVIGGSYGKSGAVVLAAKAALKSGCGLVTSYIPECGYTVLQTAFPEGMVITNGEKHIKDISFAVEAKAIAIGMGLGHEPETQEAFHNFLKINKMPLVIDADGLNILSYNKGWFELLTENTIVTPHPKELERLIGSWQDDFDKLEKMKTFSGKYKIILVAKDARTMIVYGGYVYINTTGNSALATGGSGDVLAGIIAGLLAQGYNPVDAAVFGVYLHGLTADIAIEEMGKQAFIASAILEYIGKAYLNIEQEKA